MKNACGSDLSVPIIGNGNDDGDSDEQLSIIPYSLFPIPSLPDHSSLDNQYLKVLLMAELMKFNRAGQSLPLFN